MRRMRNGNGLGRVGVVISELLEGRLVGCMGGEESDEGWWQRRKDGLNSVKCEL